MPTENSNDNDREEERRRSSGSRSQRRQKRRGYDSLSYGVVKIIDQLDDMVFGCNPIRQCDENDHRNLKGRLSDERYTNGEAAELMRDRLKEAFVHADRSSSELLTDDDTDIILRQGSESTLNTNVSAEGIAIDGGDIKKSGDHTLLEDAPLVSVPKTLTPPASIEEKKAIASEKREEEAAAAASAVEEETPSSPPVKKSIPLSSDIPTGGPTRSFFEGETPRIGSRHSSAKNFDTFPSSTDETVPRQIIPESNDRKNTDADTSAATAAATAAATIALLRAESSQVDSAAEAEAKAAATISLLGEPSLIIEAVDYDNTMSNTNDDQAPDKNKEIDDLDMIVEKIDYGIPTSNSEKCSMENERRDSPEEGMVPDHQAREEEKEAIKVGDDENNDKHEVHMPSSTGLPDYGGDGKDELDLMVEKVDATTVEDETIPIQRSISMEIKASATAPEDKPVVETENATEEDDYPSCSVQKAVLSFCDDDQGKHGSESNLEKMAVSNEGTNGTKAENHSGAKVDADGSSTQGTAEEEEDRSAAFAVPMESKDQSYEDIEVGYEEHNEKMIQKSDDDNTKRRCLGALCCGWKCACLLVVICIIIILLGAVLGTAEKRNSKQMAAVGGTADEYPGPGGDSIGALPSTGDNLPSPTFKPSVSPTILLSPVSDSPTAIETEAEVIENRPDDEEDGGVINFGATQPSDEEELPTLTDKNGLLQDAIENAPIATPSKPPTIAPMRSPSASPVSDAPTSSPASDAPTRSPSASPVSDAPTSSPVSDAPTQGPSASPVSDAPTSSPASDAPTRSPSASPVSDAPTQDPSASPVSDAPTQGPSAAPVSDAPTQGPSAAPVSDAPTRSPSTSPVSGAPTPRKVLPSSSPVAQDSTVSSANEKAGGDVAESIDGDSAIATSTTTTDCVPCTNVPTAYMLSTNQTCADFSYAFERRCGTEFGWWGRNGNPEHCQYSCWTNGVPYASQGDASCCERDHADDIVSDDTSETDGKDDSSETAGEITTDSINAGALGDSIEETSFTSECVPCTNVPTKYMLSTNQTCADYSYAFERRCGTEFGWWGRNGNPEYCQYSCWTNGVPYASQGGTSCCKRDNTDDTSAGDSSQVIVDADTAGAEGGEGTGEEASASSTTAPTQGQSTSQVEPSARPTSRPTTASPSANPTTQEPSDKPTAKPSVAPTSSTPTVSPTMVASESPSSKPTTASPSAAPTSSTPTVSPTMVATTAEPSAAPTSSSPTVSPTMVASESPSSKPTTASPSAAPTSSSPTVSPTKVASEAPSSKPTTAAPTPNPTSSPTHLPTSRAIVWEESSPGHLVTNYNTGKATDGIMLAITAKASSITITSIDVLLDTMDIDIPVELMMMEGSYFGYELYSRIWQSVGGYIIPQGNGPSRATTIQGIDPITIPFGKTIGLYIVFPEGHNMLIGSGGKVSSEGDIRIYSGSSVPGKFMSVDRGVGWSGAIKYSMVERD